MSLFFLSFHLLKFIVWGYKVQKDRQRDCVCEFKKKKRFKSLAHDYKEERGSSVKFLSFSLSSHLLYMLQYLLCVRL